MAVKVLTTEIKTVPKFPNQPIAADSLDFVFTAPSVAVDGIQFPITGRELILIQNTDVGAQTFTVAGIRDEYGFVQDLTAYSLAAGEFAVLPLGAQKLYGGSGGTVTITMSNVAVKVAVLKGINLLY